MLHGTRRPDTAISSALHLGSARDPIWCISFIVLREESLSTLSSCRLTVKSISNGSRAWARDYGLRSLPQKYRKDKSGQSVLRIKRTPLNPNPTLLAGLNYELVPASGDVSITWDTKVEGLTIEVV